MRFGSLVITVILACYDQTMVLKHTKSTFCYRASYLESVSFLCFLPMTLMCLQMIIITCMKNMQSSSAVE